MAEGVLIVLLFLTSGSLYLLYRRCREMEGRLRKMREETSSTEGGGEVFRRWFENLPFPAGAVRRDRGLLAVNAALRAFFPGRDPQNLLELPFPEALTFHEKLFKEGAAEEDFPWKTHWLRLKGHRLNQEEAIFCLLDVTREKMLEERTRTMAATLAHEFRTPLTAIRGFAEELAESLPPEKFSRQAVQALLEHSERLSRLVQEILLLASFETGLELRQEPLSVKVLLETLEGLIRPLVEKKHLKLEIQMGEDLYIRGDRDYLVQALVKLLENAVNHSPEGGTIFLEVALVNGEVVFRIRDYGPGVPEEMREKIFQPFVRGEKGGLGLGLPLARRIAEAHGGSLEMEPVSEGASFRLRVPAISPSSSQNGHK